MERNIPDVRDIFNGYGKQEMCVYDHSPRSRRRTGRKIQEYIEEDTSDSMDDGQIVTNSRNEKRHEKRSNRSAADDFTKTERNSSNKKQDYSTKTLTDRDIRHLERHLSMKKTIRKQISRNLAKAFVEDPKALQTENELTKTAAPPAKAREMEPCFTLTRAKLAKSEQNVLDMLKECRDPDTDSGHSSPVHHSSCEDEATLTDGDYDQGQRSAKSRAQSRNLDDQTAKKITRREQQLPPPPQPAESRFSFWRMFNVLGRARR